MYNELYGYYLYKEISYEEVFGSYKNAEVLFTTSSVGNKNKTGALWGNFLASSVGLAYAKFNICGYSNVTLDKFLDKVIRISGLVKF